MSALPAALEAGAALEPRTVTITRADLIRYAGASGDFNPIHWSDRVATSVGLPGVIAHGMFTMALVAGAVDAWAGAGNVVEFGCKFTRPVVVPDDDRGVDLLISGTVAKVEDGLATLKLEVTCGEEKVLGAPMAVVRA
jgi:acyl dehydratase